MSSQMISFIIVFFFFNDTATTEIYTLPYTTLFRPGRSRWCNPIATSRSTSRRRPADRKSTRLNSSHMSISYAVFCLKKKNNALPAEATPLTKPQHPNVRSVQASRLRALSSSASARADAKAFTRILFFFFNDTATTEIYTLSLHDALPISRAFDVVVTPNVLVWPIDGLAS